jgi:hypothetical protein
MSSHLSLHPAGMGSQLRLIRVLKPFKIARLMKLGKSSAVITMLMDYYEISPTQGKTLQVGVRVGGWVGG